MKTTHLILFYLIFSIQLYPGIINASLLTSNENSNYDTEVIQNKINVLNAHIRYHFSGQYTRYTYQFKQITPEEYQILKPSDNLAFDAGFVDTNGVINISTPTTEDQKAVFQDLTKVALYYLCQSYMYNFYNTRNLPLLLKVGFGMFESGLLPPDETIKNAVIKYGSTISSFDVFNNVTTFVQDKGYYIAGVFGEFMNVYKNWAYQYITQPSNTGFNTDPGWFNTNSKSELLADFNRYLYARFLQPDENLRVRICRETDHFKFYSNEKAAAINFPYFSDVCESAYNQFVSYFNVRAYEKLSFFTMIGCEDGAIEGLACDPNGRLTGGTAWSSGVHSTSSPSTELLKYFYGQNRHELAHSFQGLIGQGPVTAWLNEGFPSFVDGHPFPDNYLETMKQPIIDALQTATQHLGRRPTYEDTRIYPSNPYWDYYLLGVVLNHYLYQRGGFQLIKDVQINDLAAYQKLGYSSSQAFLDDFYFYLDIKVYNKETVSLLSPAPSTILTSSIVDINWTPLKAGTKYDVSVSTDNKMNWVTIAQKTTVNSLSWNSNNYTGDFFLKFSVPENTGLESVFGPFKIIDLNKLSLINPVDKSFAVAGDSLTIKWGITNVQHVNIEYRLNDGNLKNIVANLPANQQQYHWIIPENIAGSCKIKISDAGLPSNFTESGDFNVVSANNTGGPYIPDHNTLLLLHFDNNLNNRSYLTGNAIGNELYLNKTHSLNTQFGSCYETKNPLKIPHHINLNLTSDWTIEAWVKLKSYNSGNSMYLFWKPGDNDAYQSNYSLEINPWWGNVFYGYYFSALNNRIGITGNSPVLNEWYHVAFIRDTQKQIIQVLVHDKNRTLISKTQNSYSPVSTFVNTKDLLLGSNLDGFIDEVRISNIVRSFINTAINTTGESNQFYISPNPTKGLLYIRSESIENQFSIYDLTGKNVLNTDFEGNTCSINLLHLPKGVYVVRLKSGLIEQYQKLIIN